MAEIDPVILQLRADLTRYKNELRSTTTLVTNSLGQQERAIVDLESQIKRSSGSIGGTLKGLAGAFAGAFSLQQAKGLIDSYTRIQNQLRVAGLEGEALASTQQKLLDIGNQYGVSLETLAGLFGNATQAGTELGASQAQILQLTTSTSQALSITGTSAEQASGAILGLTQALAAGTVRAEEFNQINEGGLRPLLQAAAAGERFGGSVAKLRAAVLEGKVSSEEFFRLILAGAAQLGGQASKAALTLSGAFTKLTNALTVFVGEAAKSNGVTAAVSTGIETLANNLDTVADALAVVAAILLGRYTAGLAVAAVGAARAAGAAVGATTAFATMGAAARAAGVSLLAAFGGPVGIAITALILGIGFAVTRTTDLQRVTEAHEESQRRAATATQSAADAAEKLAGAHGKARKEALALARAEAENVKQKVASARASALLATAEALRERARANSASRLAADEFDSAGMGLRGGQIVSSAGSARDSAAEARARSAETRAGAANADYIALEQFSSILAKINATEAPLSVSADSGKNAKKTRAPKRPTGPTAAETADRFASDLRRLYAEQLQDELAIATDADRRAAITAELNELEYQERLKSIQNEKDYSTEQKSVLTAELQKRFGRTPTTGTGEDIIVTADTSFLNRARLRDLELAQIRQRENQLAIERDALEAEAQNATTRAQRLAIERRILAVQQDEERSRLESAISAGEIADAAKARADLARKQRADGTALERSNEGPLARYGREFEDIDTAIEQIEVDALRRMNDELTKSITNALGLKGALGDIVGQLIQIGIQRSVIGPLADALFGAATGGGAGGLFGGALKSLFGRASGGYVGPGQTVRVNEGRGGVELLRMGAQGGTVIPLGQARAARPDMRPVVNQTFVLDARQGITTPQLLQYVNETARQQAQSAGAASYQQSMRDAPTAVSRRQRFG